MALGDRFQILLILGVLAVILIWGPQKIPELARSIGRARKEFDDASKGLTNPISPSSPAVSASDPLTDTAHKLGINTQARRVKRYLTRSLRQLRQSSRTS